MHILYVCISGVSSKAGWKRRREGRRVDALKRKTIASIPDAALDALDPILSQQQQQQEQQQQQAMEQIGGQQEPQHQYTVICSDS